MRLRDEPGRGGLPLRAAGRQPREQRQNGNINDFSACLPNQLPGLVGTYGRQYYVDVPQDDPLVRFVMISPGITFPDGTWSYAAGTPRYDWTAAAIDQARQQDIPWVVVGMHKPCLSIGAVLLRPRRRHHQPAALAQGGPRPHRATSTSTSARKQLAHGAGCTTLGPGSVRRRLRGRLATTDLRAGAGTVFLTIGTGG